jgi:hypothetical protein
MKYDAKVYKYSFFDKYDCTIVKKRFISDEWGVSKEIDHFTLGAMGVSVVESHRTYQAISKFESKVSSDFYLVDNVGIGLY